MSSKDVGIRIRVEKELRDAFHCACAAQDRSASDLLREFMKAFAERHSNGMQKSLFQPPKAGAQNGMEKQKSANGK